ncbi:hypothetical protein HK097_011436, partial [Rhizophlyctis rosea]
CKRQIEELTFAHVNHKLFCMECHKALMPSTPQTDQRSATSPSTTEPASKETHQPHPPTAEYRRGSAAGRASAVSYLSTASASHAHSLEKELQESRRQLADTEEQLQKMKEVSKKALEEFITLRDQNEQEVRLRQQAEAAVALLRSKMDEWGGENARKAQIGDQMENLRRELAVLTSHRSTLETSVAELTTQKDKLAFEVEDLLRKRHLSSAMSKSEVEPSPDGDAATDLREQLDQIKSHFREEVSLMQRDRDTLSTEVSDLRTLRDKLASSVSHLTEENRQLELRSEQIAKQLVASAENLATEPIESSPDKNVFPNMHELVRSLSGDGSPIPGEQNRIDVVKPFLTLPPPPTTKPHGPRRDERGASSKNIEIPSGIGPAGAGKKAGWGKSFKSNMAKATKMTKATLMGEKGSNASIASSPGGGSVTSMKSSAKARSRTELKIPEKGEARPHSFQPHPYMSPRKCDLCNEKLWGKEMRCEDCGYHCHQKCASNVASNCQALSSTDQLAESSQVPVFGTDLTKLVEAEDADVPSIVRKCVQVVEQRGMDFEGIYRKSGPLTQINKIIASVNRGDDVDLDDEENYVDIMAVTSILKQYLRDLPEPLIPGSMYSEVLGAASTEDEEAKKGKFVGLLERLPKAHFKTLAFLMRHLYGIQTMSAQNLMSASNLGVVFGPTLMRPPTEQELQLDMTEASLKSAAIEYLVKHAPELFPEVASSSRGSVSGTETGSLPRGSVTFAGSRVRLGSEGAIRNVDLGKELPPIPAPTRQDSLVETVVGSVPSLDPVRHGQ